MRVFVTQCTDGQTYRQKDKQGNDAWCYYCNDCLACAKVEQETAESMQTLLKLDTIKARMKAASDALRVSICITCLAVITALPKAAMYPGFIC